MPCKELRLLALDGGGVRGLSSLMILEQLMQSIDPEHPPKPCEHFDMIGGTSTGGLIAIMLGRLEMTIDECIDAYLHLSDEIFQKKAHRVTIQGKIQGRFDSKKLEEVIKEVVRKRKLPEDTLLKSTGDGACKVFVCATSKETGETVCLTSYKTPQGNHDLLNSATIWETCRATSAASSFFSPIAIGRYGEEFVDGAAGANNPVWELWNQAQAIYGPELLEDHLNCLVSIGTGVPPLKPFRDDVLHIHETLTALATETEQTAERFRRSKAHLDDSGHYYRFNVSRGLEEIGLEESKKKKEIAAFTRRYLASQEVLKQMQACADGMSKKQYSSKYHIPFSLRGVPVLDKFADRPMELAELGQALLPQRGSRQRQIFVLSGMGGMGKTQLAAQYVRRHHERYSAVFWLDGSSEDSLKQSIAQAAARIPASQIPEVSRIYVNSAGGEINLVVEHFMNWLSQPDNDRWLVVFDNVDREYRVQCTQPGAYDVACYFPWADHGSILVTTRLSELEQCGTARKKLQKVNEDLAKAIFQQWYTKKFDKDAGTQLLKLLDGLPLALTQAGAYMQQNGISFGRYINLYNAQWGNLMQSHEKDGIPLPQYNRSIWTTWMISFEAIRTKNESAADLLLFWALLDNRDMWYGLFEAIRGQPWIISPVSGIRLQEACKDEVAFNSAVRLLLNYCLVEEMENLEGYVVHPVVHQWARHVQNEEQRLNFARLAVKVIGLAVPSDSLPQFWIVQRRLLAHAECCFQWITNDCAKILGPRKHRNEDESLYDNDSDDVLNALLGLGNLYRDQGKLETAEETYERALRALMQRDEEASTFNTVSNLNNLYADEEELEEANRMYIRALQANVKALGTKDTPTLGTVQNLDNLYKDQGKLDKAEEIYRRALQDFEKVPGVRHTLILDMVSNLGLLYADQGKLDLAKEMYQRALRGYEKALGTEHTLTLRMINILGNLYKHQGKLEEAEEMYQRALQGYEKTLGAKNKLTLLTINNLGSLYRSQRKLDSAEEMYIRALQGADQGLSAELRSTVNAVKSLGRFYKNQGKLEKTEEMYRRALQGYENAVGPDLVDTYIPALNLYEELGQLQILLNRPEEAIEMYQRALVGLQKFLGPSHKRCQRLESTIKTKTPMFPAN